MAQAIILAGFEFSAPFSVNNINPLGGVGSQMLPMNVWANPSYWPFALLDKEVATDVSSIVALAIFASALYFMVRCFDVAVLSSIITAQSSVVLFAPALLQMHTPTVFCLTPGNAVVFAPHMIALGLLGRVEPGCWRRVTLQAAAIAGMIFYSLYSDPLWTTISGFSLALAFAVVVLGPMRLRTVLIRCAVLACCVVLLVISGAAEYLYTIAQYTARVQFSAVLDRERGFNLVSAMSYSSNMKLFYLAFLPGWLLGLIASRGRTRVLVAAGAFSFLVWVAYSVVFLLIVDKPWIPPIPTYIEQCLFPLYFASAIAGYWGAVSFVTDAGAGARKPERWHDRSAFAGVQLVWTLLVSRPRFARSLDVMMLASQIAVILVIPITMANYAFYHSAAFHTAYYIRWPNEPEFSKLMTDNLQQKFGEPFRGSVVFWQPDYPANLGMVDLWTRDIPTATEYSQLVTPQALYFLHKLKKDVLYNLNWFLPNATYTPTYWGALRLFGVRYFVGYQSMDAAEKQGFKAITLPHDVYEKEPSAWTIYELSNPNIGDFSPTEVLVASTGGQVMALLEQPGFDFASKAVIDSEVILPLVPARNMQMKRTHSGIHVTGKSDATSLVILPQQFTNCLRAIDQRVRLVRADLMMTGVVFSGDLDTDIVFDYGITSPSCRFRDLADVKRLGLAIDLRAPHLAGGRLFPDWGDALARLRGAWMAIR